MASPRRSPAEAATSNSIAHSLCSSVSTTRSERTLAPIVDAPAAAAEALTSIAVAEDVSTNTMRSSHGGREPAPGRYKQLYAGWSSQWLTYTPGSAAVKLTAVEL